MGYFYTDSFGKERYAWDAQDERMSNSYRGADKNTRTVFNTPGSNIGHDIFNKNYNKYSINTCSNTAPSIPVV